MDRIDFAFNYKVFGNTKVLNRGWSGIHVHHCIELRLKNMNLFITVYVAH